MKLIKFMDRSLTHTIVVLVVALLTLMILIACHPFERKVEKPVEDWLEYPKKSKQ